MDDTLQRTGVPSEELLERFKPPVHRLRKGPVVMVECFQEIPCDPCFKACQAGAVKAFEDINDLPVIDYDKCSGCGVCISYCPGLAIFVVDEAYSENTSMVQLPYEFLPLPAEGDTVKGLDREGKYVVDARVVKVRESPRRNQTYVVSLEVPKGYSLAVRSLGFF